MSSILKALKKLEDEKKNLGYSSIQPLVDGYAQKNKQRKSTLFLYFSLAFIIGVFIIVSISFFPWKGLVNKNKKQAVQITPLVASSQKNSPIPVDHGKGLSRFAKVKTNPWQKGPAQKPIIEISRLEQSTAHPEIKQPHPVKEPIKEKEQQPLKRNDKRFAIQAIVWAADPGNRFAVVNNIIKRQGDNIDGVVIDKIMGNGIILSEGGARWVQPFRIK